jgi:hypothetical protein
VEEIEAEVGVEEIDVVAVEEIEMVGLIDVVMEEMIGKS